MPLAPGKVIGRLGGWPPSRRNLLPSRTHTSTEAAYIQPPVSSSLTQPLTPLYDPPTVLDATPLVPFRSQPSLDNTSSLQAVTTISVCQQVGLPWRPLLLAVAKGAAVTDRTGSSRAVPHRGPVQQ